MGNLTCAESSDLIVLRGEVLKRFVHAHAHALFLSPNLKNVPVDSRHHFLKHDSSIFKPCMWFMEEPRQFSVGHSTEPNLQKPLTGLGDRLNMPVFCGPNGTQPNLLHHGETTYRVG